MTQIGTVSKDFLKLRYFVYVFGGVAAQIVAILLTAIAFHIQTNTFASSFIYSNVLLILVNLIPRNFQVLGLEMPTDGMQLLRIPFFKPHEVQEILAAGKILEAVEFMEQKEYHKAEILLQEFAAIYPDFINASGLICP